MVSNFAGQSVSDWFTNQELEATASKRTEFGNKLFLDDKRSSVVFATSRARWWSLQQAVDDRLKRRKRLCSENANTV